MATLLLYPYLLDLMPQLGQTRIPLPVLIPIQVGQTAVQFLLVAWAGLRVGRTIGLDAPWLRARVEHRPAALGSLVPALLVGFLGGGVVAALDRYVLMPMQPEALQALARAIPAWKGLLASFTGGISEETMCRQFVMTMLAWLLLRAGAPRGVAMVAAAAGAALLFAAGHLPAARVITPLTPPVVGRVLVLNSLLALPFGVLFWKRGLEHAMVAHFCADLVLHVLAA